MQQYGKDQIGGGPNGLSSSGGAAELRMLNWARQVINILTGSNMTLEEFMIYVDDVSLFLKAFKKGTTFCRKCKKFRFSKSQEIRDTNSDESDTTRTARILKEMFNCLEKDLQFTVETAEDFNSNTLPTLDTQL